MAPEFSPVTLEMKYKNTLCLAPRKHAATIPTTQKTMPPGSVQRCSQCEKDKKKCVMDLDRGSCAWCRKRKVVCKDYGWKLSTRALSRQTLIVQNSSRAQEAMLNDRSSNHHSPRSGDESGSSDRSGDNVPYDPALSTSSPWVGRTDVARVQDSSYNDPGFANFTTVAMSTAYDPFTRIDAPFHVESYAHVPGGWHQGSIYNETVNDDADPEHFSNIMQYQSENMQLYQDRMGQSSAQSPRSRRNRRTPRT